MPLTLKWRDATSLPADGESLNPEILASLSATEVAGLSIPLGNTTAHVGDLFEVDGERRGRDDRLQRRPPACPRDRAGARSPGTIAVRGDVGGLLGAEMTGGTIEAEGPVGDYAGAAMRGGLLRIRGSAGRSLGSAYPGGRLGMREGVILVDGAIGPGAGLSMRRGLIAVSGPSGDDLGRAMVAGSIFAFGSVGRRAGAGMKRGTLALFGFGDPREFEPLPTFAPTGRFRPHFLTIYLRRLRQWGFPVPEAAFSNAVDRYNGDLVERGQGEILVAAGT